METKRKRNKKKNETRKSNASKKTYSTWTSRVVPHRTTIQARTCLTSQIRRDAVLSRLYGRRYPSSRFVFDEHVIVKWKKSKEEGAAAGLLDHRYLFPMVGLAPLLIDDQGNPADNENAISFGR